VKNHFFCTYIQMKTKRSETNRAGFTLIEVLVSLAVFTIIAIGVFSGIQFVFKVVYNSRLRIIETAILNEQLEIIRNISFFDVGIVNGAPPGILERTVTTTRNGIDFTITRTIRNIDDPFDGLIGGGQQGGGQCQEGKVEVCHNESTLCVSENAVSGHVGHGDTEGACGAIAEDNQPADYKLVEVEIICDRCLQQNPLRMSTYVTPKFLEGDPDHGALFVQVFDANAEPVVGADVHIVATSTDPTYDFTDTTDNDGYLRVVDLDQGVNAYAITVSKNGYVTDQTIAVSPTLSDPDKLPASVVAQDLSEMSFQIDLLSSLSVSTINASCIPIGSVGATVFGSKTLGMHQGVPVLRVNESVTTDGGGETMLSDIEWDTYDVLVSLYDVIGTIPQLGVSVQPDIDQTLSLLLGSNTTHSLLLNVTDSATDLPVANATVQVTGPASYDEVEVTGLGHTRQTDWSGGSGQLAWTQADRYWSDDGGVEVTISPGDIQLKEFGGSYLTNGQLESSVIDLGTTVNFVALDWEPFAQPEGAGDNALRFQIASSDIEDPASWDYLGYDGTAGTYYNESNIVINAVHNNDQFVRYKAFFQTASSTLTPTLSDISFQYTTSCTPPGQGYFGGLIEEEYTVSLTADGYGPVSQEVDISGDTRVDMTMDAL
jgi:prepilin-type N-terminal cleavage/methylation domain-containing protein